MKQFCSSSTLLLLFFGILSVTSCKKDTPDRDKFLGAYSVIEDCTPGQTFNMSVTESASGETSVVISNFGNFGNNVTATVTGSSITIPSQTFQFNDGSGSLIALTVTGSGSIIDNNMTITYTYTAASIGLGDTCQMTCSKQ